MNDQVKYFSDIPMEARPGVRYWVPGAAMDEQDLRTEIRALYARGFGRIELVVLSGRNPVLDCGEDGWGTKNWDRMVRIAADETEKLGMKLDIANGPGWPISSPAIKNADDPAALRELTYGELILPDGGVYEGPLPERKKIRPEGTPKLAALMAYPEAGEGVLKREGYIDLMPCLDEAGNGFRAELPSGSRYHIFAFYEQPAVHKINSGQNYVIDHLSRAGVEACKAYWKPVFREYGYPSMESFFCDSLEYEVTLEWTPGFDVFFRERFGYDLLPWLPVIGQHPQVLSVPEVPGYRFEDQEDCEMVNREFMEALTLCYCENHLKGLEEMANAWGKTIRYQVAYNKPFQEEISALYPGIPENEALGRPSFDNMKAMAAAAHLGRKKRYSFECAAEFGFGYNQTYEDLLWWVKRAQMSGMNAQVLHGASYSGAYHGTFSDHGKIPGTVWPGYEGFGRFVSNNWNRTLSVSDARKVLDRIARTNMIFMGNAKVDAAILRSDYTNIGGGGDGELYDDDGRLSNAGYSYEFIAEKLLELYIGRLKDGCFDPDGPGYRALIVMPEAELSLSGVRTLRRLQLSGFPVVFCGEHFACRFYSDACDEEHKKVYEQEQRELLDFAKEQGLVTDKAGVPEVLLAHGVLPRIQVSCSHDLITAVHETDEYDFYILYANNRVLMDKVDVWQGNMHISGRYREGTLKNSYARPGEKSLAEAAVSLECEGEISLYDPWANRLTPLDFTVENGRSTGEVRLQEDEMLILARKKELSVQGNKTSSTGIEQTVVPKNSEKGTSADCGDVQRNLTNPFLRRERSFIPIAFESLTVYSFEPETKGETSFLRSGFSPEGKEYSLEKPLAFSEIDPALDRFAGKGIYKGSFALTKAEDARYILKLGRAADTVSVKINGKEISGIDQVFRRVDVTDDIRDGKNEIEVRVVTNLHAKLTASFNASDYEKIPFTTPSMDHRSGMWEEDGFPIGIAEKAIVLTRNL